MDYNGWNQKSNKVVDMITYMQTPHRNNHEDSLL